MEAIKLDRRFRGQLDLDRIDPEISAWDQSAYEAMVSTELSDEQRGRIVEPPSAFPKQREVLAVHWHPEFIPMPLIEQRIDRMFPGRECDLIIPTQHNVLMSLRGYTGVEIDCYSAGFNLKVQLLVHFSDEKVAGADVLKAMLAHTFKYRSSQLYEYMDTLTEPAYEERVQRAAAKTGATEDVVRFVQIHVEKLRKLIDRNEATTPPDMLKNKILRFYFDALRSRFPDQLISHVQIFLHAVKKTVKANFSLTHFYRTEEIIEEVRALGGGIVIPHPEQFWPILLADYDVDGIEVWNPQSQQYTEFLVNCVHRQNKARRRGHRPLLIFMGDDTHFGEKVLDPAHQDEEKAGRELGVQPAWDDLLIRKSLIVANTDRRALIEEYKHRLA